MVCPMRFVLVGVSAIVALGVAFWAWQEHEETVKESGDEDARRQSRNGRVSTQKHGSLGCVLPCANKGC